MSKTPRLTGEPIMPIPCKKTDALAGYLYQWNNGDLQPAWLDKAMAVPEKSTMAACQGHGRGDAWQWRR